MQFNSEANSQDLISDITFLTGVSITQYPLADRARSINARQSLVWQIIFESYGGWRFMGDDQSDTSTGIPYADQTITSGTGLYGLPAGTLAVDMAEIMYATGTPMRRLLPITYEEFIQRGGDSAFPSPASPQFYLLQGDILRLLPTPNFTLAAALRVFFSKDMTQFAPSDTTATPGFAGPFHRMLSIGGSLDYALARGDQANVTNWQNLWNDYERRMRDFYSKRFKDRFPHKIGAGPDIVEMNS